MNGGWIHARLRCMTEVPALGAQLEIALDVPAKTPGQIDLAALALHTAEHADLHSVWRFASHLRELANDLDAIASHRRALEVKPYEE